MLGKKPNTEEAFFATLKAWSEIKLRIMGKYLKYYMSKRGGKNTTIHYIDGFAGRGYYGTVEEGRRDGSPIVAARVAQEIVDSGDSNRLICHFVEEHRPHYEQLRQAVSEFASDIAHVYHGTFQQHMPTMIASMGAAPAIFFLDPFGVDDVRLDELQAVSHRADTELMLNLNTTCLYRLAGFGGSTARDAAAKRRLLSRVLGEDSSVAHPEWLRMWNGMQNGGRWAEWAANRYAQQLIDNSPYLKYAVTFPIRPYFNAIPKYYLVFATRSMEPFPALNDYICTEDEDLFDKHGKVPNVGQQMLTGFLDALDETTQAEKIEKLLRAVHSYGMKHQGCSRKDIFLHFSMERFGEFRVKHYRAATTRLAETERAAFRGGRNDSSPITFFP